MKLSFESNFILVSDGYIKITFPAGMTLPSTHYRADPSVFFTGKCESITGFTSLVHGS